MSQGTKANATGREAEEIVGNVLKRNGCVYEYQVEVCIGIYGTPIIADFRALGISNYPNGLIIECKWQAAAGSVDEKYPYLVQNIKQCYPLPTLIVLAGRGYRSGAVGWLRRQVGGRLIAVMDLEEFIAWIHSLEMRMAQPYLFNKGRQT
jgi:hypothetical protein